MDDRDAVEIQIGRPPRSPVVAAARCHLGLPVVIEVPPLLDDGTPFPTHFWLSCPLAVTRIARIESAGGVRDADARIAADPELAERYRAAMVRYQRDRDSLIPSDHSGPAPRGGVAGSSGGVKCLHAHYADHAAGNPNPIGETTASSIEPLNCTVPCVIAAPEAIPNPRWKEPPSPAPPALPPDARSARGGGDEPSPPPAGEVDSARFGPETEGAPATGRST